MLVVDVRLSFETHCFIVVESKPRCSRIPLNFIDDYHKPIFFLPEIRVRAVHVNTYTSIYVD